MARIRTYPLEFREEAVRLADASERSRREVALDLGVPQSTLNNWVREARAAPRPAPATPLTGDERTELVELRRRVRVLETEREILKKAAAFFAQETDRSR
jgi:transposase